MFSMDRKLGRKGGARPHPKQHHPVPQGPPFSNKYWLATRSPPEAHKQSHLNHTAAKMHTTPQPFCPHQSSPHFPCGRSNATHRNHIHFTPSLPPVRPYSTLDHTGVHCLINWHALTFDLLPRPRKHLPGFKGHTEPGTRPPIAWVRSLAPSAKHGLVKPRPTGGNKTGINAHRHTAHTAGDTPTS
jgi:hypothetical protein